MGAKGRARTEGRSHGLISSFIPDCRLLCSDDYQKMRAADPLDFVGLVAYDSAVNHVIVRDSQTPIFLLCLTDRKVNCAIHF
jgi:hypothetical protein